MAFDIYCIDVDYIRPRLACSYLIVHEGKAAFIDCGTSHSVDRLLASLALCDLSVSDVEFVIPTHIHLDHAGGAGALMQALPNARSLIHPKGARHLINPQRLIESASQVYGEEKFKQLYGDVIPIEEERVVMAEDNSSYDLNGRPLLIVDTPGHARHHFCVYDEISNGWFTGDTFGLSYPDISCHEQHYLLPTTTPTQFEPKAWQQSLQRLLEKSPDRMYLTHFGMVENVVKLAEKLNKDIHAYVEIALNTQTQANRTEELNQRLIKYTLNDLQQLGSQQDSETILKLLNNDLVLNAQGLDFWLNRREKMS